MQSNFTDSEVLPSAKRANLTSLVRSTNFTAKQLHFHVSENFTYYHPKNKSVTHYTLQARCVKKGQRNFTLSVLFRRGELKSACGLSERLCRCALSRGRSQNAPTRMIFYRPVKPALMQVAKLSLSVRTRHAKGSTNKMLVLLFFFGKYYSCVSS